MITFKRFLNEDVAATTDICVIIEKDCGRWLKESGYKPVYRGMTVHDDHVNELPCKDAYLAKVRSNRMPKHSPRWLHNVLNKTFIDRIGIPLRSASLFCIGDYHNAVGYNTPFLIFPVGEYKYAWSPRISDPTSVFYETPTHYRSITGQFNGLDKIFRKQFGEWIKKNFPATVKKLTDDNTGAIADTALIDHYLDLISAKSEFDLGSPHTIWAKFCTWFILNNPDLWKYNRDLRHALTDENHKQHEIMVACDSYYAVRCNTPTADLLIDNLLK